MSVAGWDADAVGEAAADAGDVDADLDCGGAVFGDDRVQPYSEWGLPTSPFGLAIVTIENPGSGPVMDGMAARLRISTDSGFGATRRLRMVLSRVCK
ncbi:hypothetical protein [Rhodococcus erythropolis]|uniref:hypothetical protein n=1 Tax=Rhodococcus erythropolis TaxID=1833 RepID=UPI0002F4B06D|nr:hypothetical protein [Rhodococcus erythropolis]